MKKIGLVLLVLFVAISFMAGCSVNPSELSDDYAKEFAGKIKYVKDDRTGLCFGVIASRKSGSPDSTGIGITVVPCESCQHLLAK